jgi:hypothetical protein
VQVHLGLVLFLLDVEVEVDQVLELLVVGQVDVLGGVLFLLKIRLALFESKSIRSV